VRSKSPLYPGNAGFGVIFAIGHLRASTRNRDRLMFS
jgi:hypothetical protein